MRLQSLRIMGVCGLLASLGACVDSGPRAVERPDGPTNPVTPAAQAGSMRADLAVPRVFSVVVPSSIANMMASQHGAPVATSGMTAMPLVGGGLTVTARPDGALVFTAMTLDLGSVTLPAGGLTLVGVKLSLPGQAAAATTWRADEDVANATATADLVLDWSLETSSGDVEPPSTQRIASVPITVIVARGKDGRIVLTFHVADEGQFYRSGDLFALSDLTVDVLAAD
jgi:hypothetical protein